jgi:hypothetical protein
MGRTIPEPRYLLDTDAEQNIGNSTNLLPEPGTVGTTKVQTNPPRLLSLCGPSRAGEMTSVIFTASRKTGIKGYAGPVTGILEFGNGGRFTRVEVDVPVGPYYGRVISGAEGSIEPQDGGTIVSVPTGVLRAYCRYDNLFIQPDADSGSPYSIAESAGLPLQGPGGPFGGLEATPLIVRCMTAHYSKVWNKAYRTQYLYANDGVSAAIAVPSTTYKVPIFAKSLQIARTTTGGTLAVGLLITLQDSLFNTIDIITIASGARSPIIPIVGQTTNVVISTTGVDVLNFLALIYEIGI